MFFQLIITRLHLRTFIQPIKTPYYSLLVVFPPALPNTPQPREQRSLEVNAFCAPKEVDKCGTKPLHLYILLIAKSLQFCPLQ